MKTLKLSCFVVLSTLACVGYGGILGRLQISAKVKQRSEWWPKCNPQEKIQQPHRAYSHLGNVVYIVSFTHPSQSHMGQIDTCLVSSN